MATYKQEMPPPGGYNPVNFVVKKTRKPMNAILTIAGLYALTFIAMKYQNHVRTKRKSRVLEEEEVRIALAPFLFAEQERLYLRQLRRNRDYEAKLMADVPGWKVGHWHDVPVFHNPRGLWCDPNMDEFYAHTTRKIKNQREGVVLDY
ncbi:unnamed protein product [Dicrocoelium dendriticum]|nr:unnamed protein product [Dicrocoelium dendriticum]